MKTTFLMIISSVCLGTITQAQVGMHVAKPSTRGHTVEAIRESGERGGLLLTVGTNFTATYNQQMGEAMELWNAHRWDEAVRAFRSIRQNHSQSPWAVEAEMHEACYAKFNGQFDEAEARFLSLLKKHPRNEDLRRKVLHYLPDLYARTGRMGTALDILHRLGEGTMNWQERQFLENYSRIYSRALLVEDENRRCGTKALALALASQNQRNEPLRSVSMPQVYQQYGWAKEKAPEDTGFSMQELARKSGGKPMEISLEELKRRAQAGQPLLVYLKPPQAPGAYEVFEKKAPTTGQRKGKAKGPASDKPPTGHFVVVERVSENVVDLLDPEAGRVRWELSHFMYRWSGKVVAMPGQELQGRVMSEQEAGYMRGGCCGSPPPAPVPPPLPGNTCPTGGSGGCPACTAGGPGSMGSHGAMSGGAVVSQSGGGLPGFAATAQAAPVYSIDLAAANLTLRDSPIWYPPALGPTLAIQLVYNRVETERMAAYSNVNYYPFGSKWTFNYASYLTESPESNVWIIRPGGWVEQFAPTNDTYEPFDIWNLNQLYTSNGFFVLELHGSGEKWFYRTNTDLGQRLERIEDRYGQGITFQYGGGTNNWQLTNLVDAIHRQFSLKYNGDGRVTNITDSLGRKASFQYSTNGVLSSLTDMGGLITTINYNVALWPSNVTYPNGQTWNYYYPKLYTNNNVWEYDAFLMDIRDPLNQAHEYYYHARDATGPMAVKDRAGNNWFYEREELNGEAEGNVISAQNVGGVASNATPGFAWQRSIYDLDLHLVMMAKAQEKGVENDRWDWNVASVLVSNIYDGRHNVISSTTLTNTSGDSNFVAVSATTNQYDAKDNLVWTRNGSGQETLFQYDGQDHLTAITNALGRITRLAYSSQGLLTNLLDSAGRSHARFYNTNGWETESLAPDGLRVTKGHDAIGRLTSVTNHATDYVLRYTYDNLDRVTGILYMDGTSNHSHYGCCGVEWSRDRAGRTTQFSHDELGRMTQVVDPLSRITGFRYNGADQITNLMTYVGGQVRVKKFEHLSTNGFSRLSRVVTPLGKTTDYGYTFGGQLATKVDGNGLTNTFYNNTLGQLTSVKASNQTVLTLQYDGAGPVTNITSEYSAIAYQYDALNRATSVVTTLENIPGFATVKYRIDYQLDVSGNLTNRTITGLQGFTDQWSTEYGYDVMNRMTNVAQNFGGQSMAAYGYDAAGRLQWKLYGNGDKEWREYDSEGKLLHLSVSNSTSQVFKYDYGYNVTGNILAITNGSQITRYQYDAVNQLTNETVVGVETNAWQYDEAGNWIKSPGQPYRCYNADNEIICTSDSSTNSIKIRGQVVPGPRSNKWYHTTAEYRGVTALANTNTGIFELQYVPLTAGTNNLTVTVTDVSGNVT
jgi:YD repeat-containing protein